MTHDGRGRRPLLVLAVAASVATGYPAWAADSNGTGAGFGYRQSPDSSGRLFQSSRWGSEGSDYDAFVWDSFELKANQMIREIVWQGGYDPNKARSGGPVTEFQITFCASIPAGTQPNVVNSPLAEYVTDGKAGETPAGPRGGTQTFEYRFVLPTPFAAEAGKKYWIQIEAVQQGIPTWGLAAATGGDGRHFRRVAGVGDFTYQSALGDASFSLVASP